MDAGVVHIPFELSLGDCSILAECLLYELLVGGHIASQKGFQMGDVESLHYIRSGID